MRRVYPVLFNPNIGFEWGATLFKSTMRWRCTNRITLPRPHTRLIELRQDKIWKMKLSNRFYFPTIFFFLPLRLSNDENEVPWAHIVDKLHMISWMIRWRFCYSSPNVKPAPREKHQWRWEIWNLSTHARTHARTHTHIYCDLCSIIMNIWYRKFHFFKLTMLESRIYGENHDRVVKH